MRGRIAFYRGDTAKAIEHFNAAEQRQQWFGKIGTDVEDLQAGLYQNYAAAVAAESYKRRNRAAQSWREKLQLTLTQLPARLQSWWYLRKAKLVLTEDLDDFSDAFLRSTDSLLDYPNLGVIFASLPGQLARKHAQQLITSDKRQSAILYYRAFTAESILENPLNRFFNKEAAVKTLQKVISDERSEFDDALKARAVALLLKYGDLNF